MRLALGGFFLEERADGVASDGSRFQWLAMTAYDDEQKHYQCAYFDSGGFFNKVGKNDVQIITVAGDTWTYRWTAQKDNQSYQCRGVVVLTPDHKTSSYEFLYAEDGTNWKPWFSGRGRKVSSAGSR